MFTSLDLAMNERLVKINLKWPSGGLVRIEANELEKLYSYSISMNLDGIDVPACWMQIT